VATFKTRLLSNLRPTTRECVHLVTRGYFRSRDKDGGHTIRSPKQHKTRNSHGSVFYRTGGMATRSFTLRELGFSTFFSCDLHLSWPDGLHIWTWPVFREDIPGVQMWTSYVNAFESYHLTDRQTDTTEIIYHVASRVVSNDNTCNLTINSIITGAVHFLEWPLLAHPVLLTLCMLCSRPGHFDRKTKGRKTDCL